MNTRAASLAAQAQQDPLVALYRDAWKRIVQEQESLAGDPVRTARVRRLNELRATVERELNRLDRRAGQFFARYGERPYLAGVAQTTDGTFTAIHHESAKRLADDMFNDLLKATRYVRRDTKRFIAEAARIAARSTVLDNTAVGAGKQMMRKLIDEHGIKAVRYANGAQHPLGEYAQMTIRTKTAIAFNEGSFDGAPEVEWWQCFDGPNCGLEFHDDGVLANGLILPRDESRGFIISHPNCRRSWGPRPDITSKTGARKAQGTKASRKLAAEHSVS
jgi:hypothetical protein